jgi:hypothetical protein
LNITIVTVVIGEEGKGRKGLGPPHWGWGVGGTKPTWSIVNLIINYVIAEKQWCHVINRTTSERCREIRPATPRAQGATDVPPH